MDRHDWDSLRHEFIPSSAALAMDGQGHLLNESRYKSFLDCYWRHFHPFFPIIHSSTLALGPPPPLLALMMVTIGAMLSSSPAPSVAFYKSCVGFFTTVSFPNSINPFLPSSLLSWPRKEKEKKRKKERKEKKIFCKKSPKNLIVPRSSTTKLRRILHYRICRRLFCSRHFPGTYQGKQGVRIWPPLPGFKLFTPAYVPIFFSFLSSSAFSLLSFFLGAQIQSC